MEKVDIILPVHETPTIFLKRAVKSVLNQSMSSWNLMIIDDASSKSYNVFIKNFIKKLNDNRIKLFVNKIRLGAPGARNIGLKNSSAKFIAFLDSDDIWNSEKLKNQLEILEKSNFALVCSNMAVIDENKNIISEKHNDPSSKYNNISEKERLLSLIKKNWIKTSTVIVNKKILKSVGIFDESLQSCQDWDLWLRFALEEKLIFCSDEILTLYRLREKSISKNFSLVLKSRLAVLDKLIPLINKKYHGLINEKKENELKRNTYLSFASKYYHSGNFHQAKFMVRKSFQYGIVLKSLFRYTKCVLFFPFKSYIIKKKH